MGINLKFKKIERAARAALALMKILGWFRQTKHHLRVKKNINYWAQKTRCGWYNNENQSQWPLDLQHEVSKIEAWVWPDSCSILDLKEKKTVNIKMSQCKYLHIEEVSMCTTVHSKFHVKQLVLDEKFCYLFFILWLFFLPTFFPPL